MIPLASAVHKRAYVLQQGMEAIKAQWCDAHGPCIPCMLLGGPAAFAILQALHQAGGIPCLLPIYGLQTTL